MNTEYTETHCQKITVVLPSYFHSEVLNKYVGESEANIRYV